MAYASVPWVFAVCYIFTVVTVGGEMTVLPIVINKLFGERATEVYGYLFTYTGISNVLIWVS